MLVRLVLGLFVLKAVVASPRFSRQVDLDTYDGANYDVDLDNLNSENQDNYEYEDELTIDDPQVRSRMGNQYEGVTVDLMSLVWHVTIYTAQ